MTDKIYLENPYLREIDAKVIKKEYSNSKFYVTLNRTIFYPHMAGGQPRDKGTIADVEVLDVFKDNNEIVHVIENDIKDVIRLKIDWNTRFDHMQQHTGQHILSASFSKLLNAETLSFHLSKDYVYIDVALPKISHEEIEKVERFANEIIFSNFKVKQYFITRQDIDNLPLRKSPSVADNIRIVEIENIDYSPCGGTHCRSTGEVGLIKIRKWERYKGNTRIEFVCGNRALEDFKCKNSQINNISKLLSVKDSNCLNTVKRIYDENKELIKQIKDIKKDLLDYKYKELLHNSYTYKNIKIVKNILNDINMKDLNYIASNLLNNENIILILGTVEKNKCHIVLGCSENININLLEIFDSIKDIINARGGGKYHRVQGGGTNINKIEECIEAGYNLVIQKIGVKV
ncbi:serine-tRNA(Ala) deacylase AlaX [Caldisalinibacter kiritimatiensis]|uniref:Alanyl-tRNA synthetase family protein n=1 Tax=Caldisalinibacter kiritimatiensis TaxID=1304284 RepID=R1CP09_9FIRM|nr:serine-tRNA(Ala) deacylase AlaX [Caldisalinibacter kiritimatiensis]EOD00436.1 Alanyl-tRNA synthetase family protein [Caldisalinibacter kiritimatiensis]